MRAGALRHRIKLFRPVIERDALGAETLTPHYVATVWAKAKALSNRKTRTADQQQVIEIQEFTVRPRRDIDIDWLIEHQGRRFTVRAVDNNRPDRTIISTEAEVRHDRA
ncbi:phage head closure protein [Xenorhabdus bharatensis]|uniref:phage head closure protein n=1 Tax=Xenorhabdus bharatensis TaxID=3136256 RepID=UPI0030F43330